MDLQAARADRRRRYLDALGGAAALVVSAAPDPVEEGERRSVWSSDLYYLTGWERGRAAALLRPGAEQPFLLFVDPRRPAEEAVTGPRPGLDEAREMYGADAALPFAALAEQLGLLCLGHDALHYAFGRSPDIDRMVLPAVRSRAAFAARNGLSAPAHIVWPTLLEELRLQKDAAEIATIRQAGIITADAHVAAIRDARAGMYEYEVEALVDATFRRRGGNGAGYDSIVGAGANSCYLHYSANRAELRAGDVVLVDAGCRFGHYTADLTRTWPVGPRFSGPQRALYEVVLAAWKAGVAAVRPGATWPAVHDAALRVLCEGLIALELLDGDVDEVVHEEQYRRFYRHEIGHWLGLDVHDPGGIFLDGRARPFAPGQVLAIEPGLYVQPDDADAPEAFRGIGVRVEDDLLVTTDACEVLTPCPREIDEIEALRRG